MRQTRQTAARSTAPQRPPLQSFSFTCSCCELTENRPDVDAPDGWAILYIDHEAHAFCPACAVDLPKGDAQ